MGLRVLSAAGADIMAVFSANHHSPVKFTFPAIRFPRGLVFSARLYHNRQGGTTKPLTNPLPGRDVYNFQALTTNEKMVVG
jgi:hypothetical protein